MLRKLITSTFESIESKLRDIHRLKSKYNRRSSHDKLQIFREIENGVVQRKSFSEAINSVLDKLTGLGDPVTWALMGEETFDKRWET